MEKIAAELRITLLRGHLRIAKQHDFAALPSCPFARTSPMTPGLLEMRENVKSGLRSGLAVAQIAIVLLIWRRLMRRAFGR
jgi:hypothetical protein